MNADRQREGPIDIPLVGDLTENAPDLCEKLLAVEPGGECMLYFDSLGGRRISGGRRGATGRWRRRAERLGLEAAHEDERLGRLTPAARAVEGGRGPDSRAARRGDRRRRGEEGTHDGPRNGRRPPDA